MYNFIRFGIISSILQRTTWTSNNDILSVLDDNLAAYWGMADLTDSISNYSLTNNNVTFGSGGKNGNCATFNGTTSFLNIGDLSSIVSPTLAWTLAGWVYPSDNTSNKQYFGTGVYNSQLGFGLNFGNGTKIAGKVGIGNYAQDGTYTSNTWYHVVFVYKGDGLGGDLYINGSITTTNSFVTNFDSATTSRFGKQDKTTTDDSYWAGKMDDTMIWNVALNSNQISALYNNGIGAFRK